MLTKAQILIALASLSVIVERTDIRAQAMQVSAETVDGTTDTANTANIADTADTTADNTDTASGDSTSETKDKDNKAKIRERLKDGIVRNRPDTTFERIIPWAFYLPLALAWLVTMSYILGVGCLKGKKFIFGSSQPTDEEVRMIDADSLHEISLESLSELNKLRGNDKLHYGEFMLTYYFLNWRTAFDTYDIFAQK